MNRAPFIIIGILLLAGIFIAIFASNTSSPLAPLEKSVTTPSPTMTQTNQQPEILQTPIPTVAVSEIISATGAVIHTAKGDIELILYPEDAPKTVKNFATLSRKGFYNGLTFHRVEDWVIQGGDPTGTGGGGSSIYGDTFEDELNPEAASYKAGYIEGVLAMANRGPNTNSSQFFILTKDYPLNHAYTIFGKVTKGMDIVKKIAAKDIINSIDVK